MKSLAEAKISHKANVLDGFGRKLCKALCAQINHQTLSTTPFSHSLQTFASHLKPRKLGKEHSLVQTLHSLGISFQTKVSDNTHVAGTPSPRQ
jgi:hypothetical protein